MCFGGGGGGQAATIVMPDTRAYDRQFEMQKAAIDSQMNSGLDLIQAQLRDSLSKKEDIQTQLRDLKLASADSQRDLNEQALRMASLIGAPPPEKNAEAPVVGARGRGQSDKKGKSALRISRPTASSSGSGSGLTIY